MEQYAKIIVSMLGSVQGLRHALKQDMERTSSPMELPTLDQILLTMILFEVSNSKKWEPSRDN